MAPLDPNHEAKRARLSAFGKLLLVVGIPCGLLGGALFLSNFFTFPNEFFADPEGVMGRTAVRGVGGIILVALGGFSTIVGLSLLGFAHSGTIARYQAGEGVPVTRDVINELTPTIGQSVRHLAQSAREGLAGEGTEKVLHTCGTHNDPADRFCKGCGQPLTGFHCPACGNQNDPDARFCDRCGQAFRTA